MHSPGKYAELVETDVYVHPKGPAHHPRQDVWNLVLAERWNKTDTQRTRTHCCTGLGVGVNATVSDRQVNGTEWLGWEGGRGTPEASGSAP
jgi:hypothetical protein